jgi:hypothetical protein
LCMASLRQRDRHSCGTVAQTLVSISTPVNAVAIETDHGAATALERLRQADADFQEAQQRRKAAMEELLRAQEAELAKT